MGDVLTFLMYDSIILLAKKLSHKQKKLHFIIHKSKGFTLIEVLVVIAISSMLLGVVAINIDTQLKKGRDARRMAELKQLQSALELYYHDNSKFPFRNNSGTYDDLQGWDCSNVGTFIPELTAGGYITSDFKDSRPENITISGATAKCGYMYYRYTTNQASYSIAGSTSPAVCGNFYVLLVKLEAPRVDPMESVPKCYAQWDYFNTNNYYGLSGKQHGTE